MTHTHLLTLAASLTIAIAVGCLVSYALVETILAQIDALQALDVSR